MKRLAATAAVVALLSVGGATGNVQAADVTDPPQLCTEACGVGMVRAYPREWSDQQWVVVAVVWRDGERYAHQPVELQRQQGGRWVTVAKAVAGLDGRALFVVSSSSGRPDGIAWQARYPGDRSTLSDDSATFSIG